MTRFLASLDVRLDPEPVAATASAADGVALREAFGVLTRDLASALAVVHAEGAGAVPVDSDVVVGDDRSLLVRVPLDAVLLLELPR